MSGLLPTLDGGVSLLVGLDDAPPAPIQMGSPETGDFRGYEVDLLTELARRTGVTLRYRRAFWSVLMQELAAGTLDVICSAATVTPERAREVDFCRAHLALTLAVVQPEQAPGSLDLTGFHHVGVRRGTTAEAYLLARNAAVVAMLSESNDELYAALARQEIAAVVDDSPIAAYFARTVPGLRYSGPLSASDAEYAMVTRRGNNALRLRLDEQIAAMQNNGTLEAFRSRWLDDVKQS